MGCEQGLWGGTAGYGVAQWGQWGRNGVSVSLWGSYGVSASQWGQCVPVGFLWSQCIPMGSVRPYGVSASLWGQCVPMGSVCPYDVGCCWIIEPRPHSPSHAHLPQATPPFPASHAPIISSHAPFDSPGCLGSKPRPLLGKPRPHFVMPRPLLHLSPTSLLVPLPGWLEGLQRGRGLFCPRLPSAPAEVPLPPRGSGGPGGVPGGERIC